MAGPKFAERARPPAPAGIVLLGICAFAAGRAADAPEPSAPPGFDVELAAGDPAVTFPMFAAFDDRGRLFIAESSGLDLYQELRELTRKCRVRLLEDGDQDGVFEKSTVHADGLVFPMGLAWRDGRLYVADPPDLVVLEDADGDGRADARKAILGKFGHLDNGSLHGLFFGPDDRLYMTMGYPDGYRLELPGGGTLEGGSGALFRCRPDGSGVEVISRGFDNLVEIAFTGDGEIVGTANWYQLPTGGVRDALVHLADGGLYPRQLVDRGTPHPVTGGPLPPLSLFPAVALSGLLRYEGAAFPPEMRGNLFSAQHNSRAVGRHVLRREGSTFRSEDHVFVTSASPDFHPSDVIESPDGSLLVVDTGGWYVQHCPTGRIRDSKAPGGIWRVRFRSAPRMEDPCGARLAWDAPSPAEMAARLGDDRPGVRERARRRLAALGAPAVPALERTLEAASPVARREAAWALASIPGEPARAAIESRLAPVEPVLAARVLGSREEAASRACLERLLASGTLPVRRAAAEALARCGSPESFDALAAALGGERDPFLEHAIVYALHRTAPASRIEEALSHAHPAVERAAVILLDQHPRRSLSREAVFLRLASPDAGVRSAALDALARHGEWAEEGARVLEALIEKPAFSPEDERTLQVLVAAFGTRPRAARALGRGLGPEKALPGRGAIIIDALCEARAPRVPDAWVEGLRSALEGGDPVVRPAAARAAALLGLRALDEPLSRIAASASEAPELRVEALRAIVPGMPSLDEPLFELLASRLAADEPLARMAALDVLVRARLDDDQLAKALEAVRADPVLSPGAVLPLLERCAAESTAEIIARHIDEAVRAGWKPRAEDLERVIAALPDSARESVRRAGSGIREASGGEVERLRDLEPLLEGGDPARGRAVFFGKKVACSTCHRIGSEGGLVGPDLTRIGAARSGRDLLESVVFPSSTLAQGHDAHAAVTAEGAVVGIIARQTSEVVVLRTAGGGEVQLRRGDLIALERQGASLMPEGLERAMAAEEMRDLMAFLMGLR